MPSILRWVPINMGILWPHLLSSNDQLYCTLNVRRGCVPAVYDKVDKLSSLNSVLLGYSLFLKLQTLLLNWALSYMEPIYAPQFSLQKTLTEKWGFINKVKKKYFLSSEAVGYLDILYESSLVFHLEPK